MASDELSSSPHAPNTTALANTSANVDRIRVT
jgi:hypothetical protein